MEYKWVAQMECSKFMYKNNNIFFYQTKAGVIFCKKKVHTLISAGIQLTTNGEWSQ